MLETLAARRTTIRIAKETELASTFSSFIGTDGHGNVLVKPIGELDTASAPEFIEAVRPVVSQLPNRLLLDFGSVAFIDSAGCSALAIVIREAQARRVRIQLAGDMPPAVRRVLELTMLEFVGRSDGV
jgi:anti-anti-sigma factor